MYISKNAVLQHTFLQKQAVIEAVDHLLNLRLAGQMSLPWHFMWPAIVLKKY